MDYVKHLHGKVLYLCERGSFGFFFEAKSGVRQGDPISLNFCNVYGVYVVRNLLAYMRSSPFTPSAELFLHLSFADDVIMMCSGDLKSGEILIHYFDRFSSSSSL